MWLLSKDSASFSSSDYKVAKVLNQGKTGEVTVAVNKKGKTVVLKKIDSNVVAEELVNNEVECCKKLKHSNIVRVNRVFKEAANTFLEMEYLQGVDLYYLMEQREFQPIPETECKKIFKQLVKAVIYMHQKCYVHRDLKLENIFICEKTKKVKILDFGMATKVPQDEDCSTWCGSIGYVCPEIIMRVPYSGYKADVWSLGTILYALLFAELPFLFSERVEAVLNGDPHPPIVFPANLKSVSEEATDLVLKMLQTDPQSRISMKDVANHPWLKSLKSSKLLQMAKEPKIQIGKRAVSSS